MESRRVVTLEDVAREAGVSVSTASRTLNGRTSNVSEDLRGRVRAAADKLGYATNLAAQAMAVGRSRSLGLIVGSMPEDYQNPVASGVFRSAAARDMLVSMAVTPVAEVERTRQVVRQLRGLRCSTVFVVGSETPDDAGMPELLDELAHVENEGGRVVMIGTSGTPFDSVVVDDRRAGADMARALLDIGYREFSVLAGLGPGRLSIDRLEGFSGALRESGIELSEDRVIWQEFSHDGGYRAAGELLRRRPAVEVLFCANDSMAIGAAVRLKESGIAVGPEIGVAGCDDMPALRDIDPPLTTMHLPWAEAAESAFALAGEDISTGRSVVLEGYPILRLSTPGR